MGSIPNYFYNIDGVHNDQPKQDSMQEFDNEGAEHGELSDEGDDDDYNDIILSQR